MCIACNKVCSADSHLKARKHGNCVWWWLGENMPQHQSQVVYNSITMNRQYAWYPGDTSAVPPPPPRPPAWPPVQQVQLGQQAGGQHAAPVASDAAAMVSESESQSELHGPPVAPDAAAVVSVPPGLASPTQRMDEQAEQIATLQHQVASLVEQVETLQERLALAWYGT